MLRRAQTAHRNTVSFGDHLANSETFKLLFREGMLLVEEAASYLDGPGRRDSRLRSRRRGHRVCVGEHAADDSPDAAGRMAAAAARGQRGRHEPAQAQTDKHRVNLTRQEFATSGDVFAKLPERLKELAQQSQRLQDRILHLDQLIHGGRRRPRGPGHPFASSKACARPSTGPRPERRRAGQPLPQRKNPGASRGFCCR